MNLSIRLEKALSFINENDLVADIGADHGYLSLAMLDKGVSFVQIVENKTEPLKKAQSTLNGRENVVFSLSDGISNLDDRIDTITICGMGGLNIVEILNNDLERARSLKKIVLQANSKLFELRKYLSDEKFMIVDEAIVLDKGKYYELIVCNYQENSIDLTYEQCYFGPILMLKQSNDFKMKYLKIKNEYLKFLINPEFTNEQEINELKKQINMINKYVEV